MSVIDVRLNVQNLDFRFQDGHGGGSKAHCLCGLDVYAHDVDDVVFGDLVILRKKSEEGDPYQAFIGNGADESSWAAYWKSPEIVDVLNTVQQWKC